jgi:alpha/beta hydrolase fold
MPLSRRSFLSRRSLLQSAFATGVVLGARRSVAQSNPVPAAKSIATPILNIAYEESGSAQGIPIILLHGFPDDVRAWDGVVPPLAKAGHRVLVPYLRGYGPTSFRDATSPRI